MSAQMNRIGASCLLAFICAAAPIFTSAQSDTVKLKKFDVVGAAIEKDLPGAFIDRHDLEEIPLAEIGGMDQVLQSRTNLNLRGYGPGGSYGLSIRGSSPSQVQVAINGIPFDNPGLAQADLSLLSVAGFSDVAVYRGSSSAYVGNAAVGGAILIKPTIAKDNSISQMFGFGSFGRFASSTQINFKTKQLASTTQVFYREARNDFDRPNPLRRQEMQPVPNAAFESYGVSQNLEWIRGSSTWNLFFFGTATNREIPPNLSKPTSKAFQEDRNGRLQIGNAYALNSNSRFETDIAVDFGSLLYVDPLSNIDAPSNFTTFHIQSRYLGTWKKWRTQLGLLYRHSIAETSNYTSARDRSSPAIYGGVTRKFNSEKTEISAFLRQEFLNGSALPLIPVVSATHKLAESFEISASAGRSYRIPGLNDLFWEPGGNPDLKPESGWFQEAGFAFNPGFSESDLSIKATAFHRIIDNWIIWRPGPSYWSPQNLRSVKSQGVESSLTFNQRFGEIGLKHSIQATYAESTNLEPAFEGDQSHAKQLIYTPKWSVNAVEELLLKKGKYRLVFAGNYMSERFVNFDNSLSLDPFFTLDVALMARVPLQNSAFVLSGACNNVFNHPYQLQTSHNMPGINFEIGIKYQINLKNKK